MDEKLIYLLYRALQWAASPFILLYFVLRVIRDHRYLRRFPERLGFLAHSFRQDSAGAIWVHAVSVGEVASVAELLRRLRARLPLARLFVSTSTIAGRALADEKLSALADGVFYAPIDYCFAVRRVLRTLRPAAVVVAETEIWPNLYREAKRAGCGLVVVNGRISASALPRYRRFARFFRQALRQPDRILAQSEENRRRYLGLGAPAERLSDGGNLKYDFQPGASGVPEPIRSFLGRVGAREIWIAASTMPPTAAGDADEDDVVIGTFKALAAAHPGLLLILVPRRPERFGVVAEKLKASGVPFVRRSRLEADPPALRVPGVLLLDSIGELSSLFEIESVVFMGGSLARRGGHNLLEPALHGRAVVVGPHMENFHEIAGEFAAGGGCVRINGTDGLEEAVDKLLRDTAYRDRVGERARRLAESKRGATDRAAEAIVEAYEQAIPVKRPVFPLFQVLWVLSQAWRAGAAAKRAATRRRSERLDTPVISVGGLSIGGSGKTPFVLWLAGKLRNEGGSPAILTRGYRRRAPEPLTVLAAGERAAPARTGDEAQIFLRSGVAPVGIGADRVRTGREVERRFQPDVIILDDGFQHWKLARDLEIVLVDVLDPLGGGNVFPLGRLREPPTALIRADVFVLTRTEPGRSYEGIKRVLREHNREAPILRSQIQAQSWVDARSGRELELGEVPLARAAAFCGLANPETFWRTLAALGCVPLIRWDLGDHHRYRPVEIKRMAVQARQAGAEVLLTTEKDAMNLCEHIEGVIAPLRLLWLRIGVEVEEAERLLLCFNQRRSRSAQRSSRPATSPSA
ncbi:MAG: tetraacyldisaccharide 4'-kinase [Bryobacteraceae bacterium]